MPSLLEKIVDTHAVCIVSIRHATDLMDDVFIAVQTGSMENCVIKVHHNGIIFFSNQLTVISVKEYQQTGFFKKNVALRTS